MGYFYYINFCRISELWTVATENRSSQKAKANVFQASFLRGELLNFGECIMVLTGGSFFF